MRITMNRFTCSVLLTISMVIMAGVYLGTHLEQGLAHQAANVGYVTRGDDVFRNYDFMERTYPERWDKVDWAVTMLYWNNAEVDKVKTTFRNEGYTGSGSTMWARLTDNNFDWHFDADGGVKVNACYNAHQRIYADPDDRMYNPDWGYFVFATTHLDEGDQWFCSNPKRYGWSELAEQEFAQAARDAGLAVAEDWVYMANNEPPRTDTSGGEYHRWDNNAYATRVYYP